MKIAIAGTVGISNAVLLAQHNLIVALDKQLLANNKDIPQNIMRKDFIAFDILARNPKVVGIYRRVMNAGARNFRGSVSQDIMKGIKANVMEGNIKVLNLCSQVVLHLPKQADYNPRRVR